MWKALYDFGDWAKLKPKAQPSQNVHKPKLAINSVFKAAMYLPQWPIGDDRSSNSEGSYEWFKEEIFWTI